MQRKFARVLNFHIRRALRYPLRAKAWAHWPNSLGAGARVMKHNVATRFFRDQSGTTVIEYGLIAALITVVCIGGMTVVGNGRGYRGDHARSLALSSGI
jgi:Flp pilus assembly pilin Flp